MKMISPVYLTILSLMIVYCKSDAMPSKDMEPLQCYQCDVSACGMRPSGFTTCPPERPYCATIAGAPNFTSSLTCASVSESPCSLTLSAKQMLELICICTTHLCNAPFSRDLQYELIIFSASNFPKNHTDYIEMFWKQSNLVIDNDSHIYQKITMKMLGATETPIHNVSKMNTASTSPAHAQPGTDSPRAEMLKQQKETTLPSDDDEDESEGSGAGAEEEGLAPRRPTPAAPAAPAAPSSYLPADSDDNSAHRQFVTLIATVPALFYLLV